MKNHLKHLRKTFFSPPRTKNDRVNDIKEQTLLQNQQKSNPKHKTFSDPEQNSETTKKTSFSIKNRIKTKTLHANHSTNKKKTSFCMSNHLKEQPLHVFQTKTK